MNLQPDTWRSAAKTKTHFRRFPLPSTRPTCGYGLIQRQRPGYSLDQYRLFSNQIDE